MRSANAPPYGGRWRGDRSPPRLESAYPKWRVDIWIQCTKLFNKDRGWKLFWKQTTAPVAFFLFSMFSWIRRRRSGVQCSRLCSRCFCYSLISTNSWDDLWEGTSRYTIRLLSVACSWSGDGSRHQHSIASHRIVASVLFTCTLHLASNAFSYSNVLRHRHTFLFLY